VGDDARAEGILALMAAKLDSTLEEPKAALAVERLRRLHVVALPPAPEDRAQNDCARRPSGGATGYSQVDKLVVTVAGDMSQIWS